MVKNNDIYQFENLSAFPSLIHGFSTRAIGDMRRVAVEKAVIRFSEALSFSSNHAVFMEQVHGGRIYVKKGHSERYIAATDGMVTAERGTFLCVRIADCVPLLAYDPKKEVVGVAHAGWRGIIHGVVENFISTIQAHGSEPRDIVIGIGPSIRECCYAIDAGRAKKFTEKFYNKSDALLTKRDEQIYLSLQEAVLLQLEEFGVRRSQVEDSNICTKDNTDSFYSFRQEQELAGRFAGIIGMR